MKICFLGDGQHVNTQSWINYISEVLGHEVHIITFGHNINLSRSVKVYKIGSGFNNFLRYIVCVPKVKKLVCEIQPDILIGYRITSYGFMAASTGYHPLIMAAQGQNIAYDSSRVKALFCRYAIGKADMIHSWGENMTQKLLEFGAHPEKIMTLPRGINTSLFSACPPKYTNPLIFNLISTRGLNPDYNFNQILKAISVVRYSFRNFKYSIVGDGPYKAKLLQSIKELGIEDFVEFKGKVPHDSLPSLLQESDIYIATVATDGVSTSLLEAMACGVFPIVTRNTSNSLWIEDGVNGYLVDYGDHEGLVRKIRSAFENLELRNRAKTINRKIVNERASIDVNMRKFEIAWEELLRKADGRQKRILKEKS